jgi:hypothetical protein
MYLALAHPCSSHARAHTAGGHGDGPQVYVHAGRVGKTQSSASADWVAAENGDADRLEAGTADNKAKLL